MNASRFLARRITLSWPVRRGVELKTKRIVILDLDGTLLRSVRWSIEVFCSMLAAHGVKITPALRREVTRRWGTQTALFKEKFFPQLSDAAIDDIYRRIGAVVEIVPFLGMRAALELMRDNGVDLYGFTARGRIGALRVLGRYGLRELFTRVICLQDVGELHAKPAPRGLNLILGPLEETLGLSRDEAVFVGDGICADLVCAQNAGVEFIAVHEEDVITRADWLEAGVAETNIVRSVRDLPAWLGIT